MMLKNPQKKDMVNIYGGPWIKEMYEDLMSLQPHPSRQGQTSPEMQATNPNEGSTMNNSKEEFYLAKSKISRRLKKLSPKKKRVKSPNLDPAFSGFSFHVSPRSRHFSPPVRPRRNPEPHPSLKPSFILEEVLKLYKESTLRDKPQSRFHSPGATNRIPN